MVAPRNEPGLRTAGALLTAGVYAATVALAIYVTRIYFLFPQTDDAYVRANTVGIAPHVSGPIVELPIRDNQHVKKGCSSSSIHAPTRPTTIWRTQTWT